MKTCQEIEVQLNVLCSLNEMANEAQVRNLVADATIIRATLSRVANIRLDRCSIKEGEFWNILEEEMTNLKASLSPRFLKHPDVGYDPVNYLSDQRRVVTDTHLPHWVFLLLWPIEKYVFDWSKEVPTES
jgi:hypothetical protein